MRITIRTPGRSSCRLRHQLHAVAVLQVEVEHGELGGEVGDDLVGLLQAAGGGDLEALALERPHQVLAQRRIVVDEQDLARLGRRAAAAPPGRAR